MKKSYITPEALQVSLAMSLPLAGSPLNVTKDGDTAELNDVDAEEGSDALVKGTTNLWDEVWQNVSSLLVEKAVEQFSPFDSLSGGLTCFQTAAVSFENDCSVDAKRHTRCLQSSRVMFAIVTLDVCKLG